jgi:hypothetical protein
MGKPMSAVPAIDALKVEHAKLSNTIRIAAGDEGVWISPMAGDAIAWQVLGAGYRNHESG